jgi:hypothetical protein
VIHTLHPNSKDLVPTKYSSKIKTIEYMFNENRPIDTKTLMDLGIDYAILLQEYDLLIKTFETLKDNKEYTYIDILRFKEAAFHFRS